MAPRPPQLSVRFGDRLRPDVRLAPLTTFRVGGPADWMLDARSAGDVLDALRAAAADGVPVTFLGGGSNVVVADAGVRGLVLRLHGGDVVEESASLVRADAGVTINGLVRWTIARGLAGLELWAGTPGTVGGGIRGNAHFRGHLLSEIVHAVRLATRAGDVRDVPAQDMAFGYDASRVQRSGEIVLSAVFSVSPGNPEDLRETARASLAFRKQTQPLHRPSAGCIFQNPDPARDPLPPGMPASAGALIDRAGLKGAMAGGARVSPLHANFIVNSGTATAADIRTLVQRCQRTVAERFGVTLREEVEFVGAWTTGSTT
jgi:UDP-N-acetylmuramate dehydrogenase